MVSRQQLPPTKGVVPVESQSLDLSQLLALGRQQGYITYEQVNEYLPDEANTAELLDEMLLAFEQAGVEIIDANDVPGGPTLKVYRGDDESNNDSMSVGPAPVTASTRLTNDPIRLYLSQMCEIPLLNRDQEIALAKKIEITRRKFRRAVLGNDFAMRQTVEVLRKVAQVFCLSIVPSKFR